MNKKIKTLNTLWFILARKIAPSSQASGHLELKNLLKFWSKNKIISIKQCPQSKKYTLLKLFLNPPPPAKLFHFLALGLEIVLHLQECRQYPWWALLKGLWVLAFSENVVLWMRSIKNLSLIKSKKFSRNYFRKSMIKCIQSFVEKN